MNPLKISLTFMLFCLFAVLPAQNQNSRKEKKAEKEAALTANVQKRIENKDFTLEVYQIHPTGGRSINSADGYSLTMKNDSCRCYLPYFGTARTAMYGSTDNMSIEVKWQVVNPQYSYDEKKGHVFEFDAKLSKNRENCRFRIQIFNNGNSSIGCTMNSRDYISYSSQMKGVEP